MMSIGVISRGWQMAKHMHPIIVMAIKEVIHDLQYISFIYNKVTTTYCHSWIFIHCYVVQDWQRLSILVIHWSFLSRV